MNHHHKMLIVNYSEQRFLTAGNATAFQCEGKSNRQYVTSLLQPAHTHTFCFPEGSSSFAEWVSSQSRAVVEILLLLLKRVKILIDSQTSRQQRLDLNNTGCECWWKENAEVNLSSAKLYPKIWLLSKWLFTFSITPWIDAVVWFRPTL